MILLYHEHRRRYIWNAVMMAATTFMALYIPLSLQEDLSSVVAIQVLYWAANILFVVDVYVRYVQYRNDEPSGSSARLPFLAGWFLLDWLAALPIVLITGPSYLQLIRLVKLLRVAQFIRQLRQAEVRLSNTLTLISFFFWAALFIHWLSCGWMEIYGAEANVDNTTKYVSSLYWTITTLTAVGYGDIVPITNLQRLYAILVQVSGVAVFGYLIANVVSIISKMDAVKARYVENIDLLTTTLKRRELSKDLQRRILDYYAYQRDDKTGYDESAFLLSLPDSLRTEVALDLKKEFIEGIPLFKHASERFIAEVALQLELTIVTPGHYLFMTDDPGDAMYFVISGNLEVLNKEEDRVLTRLKDGDFFGEIALFKSIPRSASVKAIDYCNLYRLERKTFESVMVNHPEIAAQIEQKARAREERYFDQ